MQLRKVNLQDVPLLKYWDTQAHVSAADPEQAWDWESDLQQDASWVEQLIAELDGMPIGFIQIIDPAKEPSHYWGDIGVHKRAIDIWIGEPKHLGKGFGRCMMELAVERCFVRPEVKEVLVDPLETNRRAIRFYQKLGFQFVCKQVFGTDKCEVYTLSRADWVRMKK